MTQNLQELIKIYSLNSHIDFSTHLLGQSKDTLIALLSELLTTYINDKNSSTIREALSVTLAGYTHNPEKLGFNGFRQNSFGKPINCEAKPKNIRSNENKKLNGGGNFTDYTWARFHKDKQENLNLLISGFLDGKLLYLFEFPFNDIYFLKHLESQLNKKFPNGDIKGLYLRSASFSFTHYKNAEIHIIYVCPQLERYEKFLEKNLFAFLKANQKATKC